VVQQGPPPPRSGPPPASGRPRRGWSDGDYDDDDEEYPPWAGPGTAPRWADHDERERQRLRGRPARTSEDAGTDHHGRRPGRTDSAGPAGRKGRKDRGRAAAGARRDRRDQREHRDHRGKYIWGGAFVAVLLIVAAVGYEFLHRPSPKPVPDSLVTTFQRGEFKTVPNACSAVTAATLNQYLPGNRRTVTPRSLYGSAQSLCDWTLDAKPLYRVLQVTVRSYAPSGLASGNGSATFAAKDAYQQAGLQKTHPGRNTHLPKAAMSQLPGLGSSAFAALQVPSASGDPTNLLTVVVRDHNVLITVVSQGPAKARHGYTPAPPAQLQAAAVAVARNILAQVH
jgi:hypothetical protein